MHPGIIQFDNTYARLPARLFAPARPTPVAAAELLYLNRPLADLLGLRLDGLSDPELAQLFSGNSLPTGAEPIALAYAGHQFGSFVPRLGDGRAILLGEVVGRDGLRRDLQLKGCGRTPYSRGGDGRAALGPVLREYLLSEFMAALGVPTTRALAAVATGEPVLRETVLPGAVLTRVAASHLRVGTFEYLSTRGDRDGLAQLVAYALDRHAGGARAGADGARALVEHAVAAQAELVARWLGIGFVHGVMNTDNTSISGETIDYGPCAFLDEHDPLARWSSIDHAGRYAFGNQPRIAMWNLARLAEALLPLLDDDEGEAVRVGTELVERFPATFAAAYGRVLRAKLGLVEEHDDDLALATDLLERMASGRVDHTNLFRALCEAAADPRGDARVAALWPEPATYLDWAARWRARLGAEGGPSPQRADAMRGVNPAFIPRNHRVEQALEAAVVRGDLAPFERLRRTLERPYEDQPGSADLAAPPLAEERVRATFCGT